MTAPLHRPDWEIRSPMIDRLGESPVWDAAEQALYWIDFYGPTIRRLSASGVIDSWILPGVTQIGSIVRARGGLLAATDRGLFLFRLPSGDLHFVGDPNQGRADIGYNDAKTDRQGRYWVGTFDASETAPRGILYCLPPGGPAHVADSGYIVCNGPAFSPDGATLYFSDSLGRQVIAYGVGAASPTLSNRRRFFTLPEDEGIPDGLTVDEDGHVWLAHYGAGLISRLDPQGTRIARYAVPAANVTSLCFGGPDLRTVFVTTGIDPQAGPESDAFAGRLLGFVPGCRGLEDVVCTLEPLA